MGKVDQVSSATPEPQVPLVSSSASLTHVGADQNSVHNNLTENGWCLCVCGTVYNLWKVFLIIVFSMYYEAIHLAA